APQSEGHAVRNDHTRSERPAEYDVELPHDARTDHDDGIAGTNTTASKRFHHACSWLDQARGLEAEPARKFERVVRYVRRRSDEVFRHSARPQVRLAPRFAVHVVTAFARPACAARSMMVHEHMIAFAQGVDALPYACDDTRRLVPKDERSLPLHVPAHDVAGA